MNHPRLRPRRICLCVILLGLLPAGCGSGQVKLVPVEGELLINKRPAANISVQFLPDGLKGNKGPTSIGTTDKDGKFRLKTHDGKEGAALGPHNVILADLDEDRPAQGQPQRQPSRIPPQYTTVGPNGLNVEVKEGGGPLKLTVTGF